MEYNFAFFDGDGIGDKLEILLIENKLKEAKELSENLKGAFSEINSYIIKKDRIEIIISGGDDLLIRYNTKLYNLQFFEDIRNMFFQRTGLTLSCGIGNSPNQAVRNLYLAKLYGKNQIKY